ncbi:MAG TPA: Druantia anti-phage system protein DruA [Rhizomicrobium sp.]|jgi:hypothetical protein|nr:Druantia anti-phage system protein DruA [Rhizomicrobium sp.]
MKKKPPVIAAFTPEAVLKRKIRAHLRKIGFSKSPNGALQPPSSSKATIRELHSDQRKAVLKAHREFVKEAYPKLKHHFAEGKEIDPDKIAPELELVEAGTWQSNLFRLASLSWSVPVSSGFGRRLRYLVWDTNNKKLMGIIALGDPVFNLRARDTLIEWSAADRGKRLVNILDAYVLGAVPPYNMILGGKLVSCLVRSQEIRDDFAARYGKTRGIISRKKKGAQLAVVTTSSSLGRSSVYNRLKLAEQAYFTSIGYTQGWGHFHVPDYLFVELRNYLRKRKHKYVDGQTASGDGIAVGHDNNGNICTSGANCTFQTPSTSPRYDAPPKIGNDNTTVGVPVPPSMGNGNTFVGPTDSNGTTMHNKGGIAIGNGACADSTSVAIGAHANAGQCPH